MLHFYMLNVLLYITVAMCYINTMCYRNTFWLGFNLCHWFISDAREQRELKGTVRKDKK